MNFAFLTFLVILRTGTAFILELNAPRNVSKVLSVTNGAPWGGWGPPQFCAAGTYAIGYALKMESNQHGGDDTALNSIKLVCKGLDAARFGGRIISLEGPFGSWTAQVECDNSDGTPRFLTAFALQVEPDQYRGDDTAANFLKFQCTDFAGYTRPTELSVPPGHGLFGTMGSWSPSCPANSAICGIRTSVEGEQGRGDDTALNNVIFYCCNEGDF